jgi:hypothetical protein
MPNTRFYPVAHGFLFSNNAIRWSYHGTVRGRNLCGGMSFASLDYYYKGVAIPQQTTPPQPGTPLHNYIYQRQVQAHYLAFPWLAHGTCPWGRSSLESCSRGSIFSALRRRIDNMQPIPILLADKDRPQSVDSHWVVAIGYEESNGVCDVIKLYDNNHPRRICRLVPDTTRGSLVHGTTNHEYRYYVPASNFQPRDPRRPMPQQSVAPLMTNPFGIRPPGI